MATETAEKVRVIQFQMTTDAVTGGAFQITSDIPRNTSAAEVAAELAVLREAGLAEMAASNRRRLKHAQIVQATLEANVKRDRSAGKHISNSDLDKARMQTNYEMAQLEAVCTADDAMLLENTPALGEQGH